MGRLTFARLHEVQASRPLALATGRTLPGNFVSHPTSQTERSRFPYGIGGASRMSSHEQGIERIRRLSRQAERRLRLGLALRTGARALCAALAVAVVDVALNKAGAIGSRPERVVLASAGVAVLVAAVVSWCRRLPAWAGSRALDRFHNFHDRLASALAFAERPVADRTPFMNAAIEDAEVVAAHARPRQAVPLGVPRALGPAAGLAAVLLGALLYRPVQHATVAHAKMIDPVEMSSDDLEDVRDFLKQIEQSVPSDDTKAAAEEFNRLVDDLANKRLDRTEAFRRMGALDDKLQTGSEADKKAFEEQLDRIGDELKKADLTRPAGVALADQRLDRARDALHELAKKLRAHAEKPVDKEKLDEMRAAIKKAAADAEQRQRELEQRRQELADEILRMKEKGQDGGSDAERSLLEKKQRELERLDRELDAHKDAGQKLDRLDRELEQAAEDLMKDLGLSAQDLDQGAEDINHMNQEELTQKEKEELRQKLQELRELVRQEGQGGKGQIARLRRFSRMAHGQGGSQGQGGTQQGGGQDQQPGGSDGQGEQGQGDQGQGGQPSPGGQGGSQGSGQGGETWVLGPNGEKMLMLSKGQGGGGQGEQGGAGQGEHGRNWGEGHDPKLQGNATNPKMATEDTQVQAADTGQGGSRSQVILGAAERGFASRGYKRVFTEYHQVAEESLGKAEIPGGYRSYVKRYFQLIRPREVQ
jgi:hypothetical protein